MCVHLFNVRQLLVYIVNIVVGDAAVLSMVFGFFFGNGFTLDVTRETTNSQRIFYKQTKNLIPKCRHKRFVLDVQWIARQSKRQREKTTRKKRILRSFPHDPKIHGLAMGCWCGTVALSALYPRPLYNPGHKDMPVRIPYILRAAIRSFFFGNIFCVFVSCTNRINISSYKHFIAGRDLAILFGTADDSLSHLPHPPWSYKFACFISLFLPIFSSRLV